jgi:hypothetical protein
VHGLHEGEHHEEAQAQLGLRRGWGGGRDQPLAAPHEALDHAGIAADQGVQSPAEDQQRQHDDPEHLGGPEGPPIAGSAEPAGPLPQEDQRDQVVQVRQDHEVVGGEHDRHRAGNGQHRPRQQQPATTQAQATPDGQDDEAEQHLTAAGRSGPGGGGHPADDDAGDQHQQ